MELQVFILGGNAMLPGFGSATWLLLTVQQLRDVGVDELSHPHQAMGFSAFDT